MEDFKVRTCKFCFDIINDEVIASHSQDDLDVNLLKVDFDDTEHVICNVCSAKLFTVQKFKTTCLYTENAVNHYVGDAAVSPPLDIKEVYMKERTSKNISDNVKICRLCLQPIKNVSELKAINAEEVDMIQKLVPEMNVFTVQEPVMCKDCQDSLGMHCNFLKKNWEVEPNSGNVSNGQVSKASSPEPSDNISMKVEGVDLEFENVSKFVKTECVDIKCEEIKSASDYEITSKEPTDGKNGEITTQYYNSVNEHKTHMYQCEQYAHDTKFEVALNGEMVIQGNPSTQKNCSEVQISKSRNCNFDTYKCEICNYETRHKFGLKSHMLIHKDPSEVQIYKCETCSWFHTKHIRSFKRHMLRHKDPLVEMYKCEACNFETKHKGSLKGHMLLHKDPSEVQMYKCEMCNYETKYNSHLKRHTLVHNDPSTIQMYKCGTCSYETKNKDHLKTHMLMHKNPSEVQIYKCAHCNYETIHNSRLKRHRVVHKDPLEVQMYVCETCNFKTRRKWNLKIHMLIHKNPSELEIYKCEECSYETMRKGSLKTHMLIHKDPSEGQIYKCETCSLETKYKRSIEKHMLHHKDP